MASTLKIITAALVACAGVGNAASLIRQAESDVSTTAASGDTEVGEGEYITTIVIDVYSLLTGLGSTATTESTTTGDSAVVDNCAALVHDVANSRSFSDFGKATVGDAEAAAMDACTGATVGATESPRDCQAVTSFCSDKCVALAYRYDWSAFSVGTGSVDDVTGLELPFPASATMSAAVNRCTQDTCLDEKWAPVCDMGIPICYVDYLVCGLGSVEWVDYVTGKRLYTSVPDSDPARFPMNDPNVQTIMDLTAAPAGGFPLNLDSTTTADVAASDAPVSDVVDEVAATVSDAIDTAADVVGDVVDEVAGVVDDVVDTVSSF